MSTHEETIRKLNHMKLYAMAQFASHELNQPQYQELSHQELIALMVDQEFLEKENKKLKRRLSQARFKVSCSLEAVDYSINRGLNKAQFRELGSLTWIGQKQNILLIGPTGLGKSFLAQALAHKACLKGYSAHYLRFSHLLEQLLLARAEGAFTTLLTKLSKFDVLILDDWGLASLNQQQAQDLLDLIEARHEIKSTIITTQIPTNQWHEFIQNQTIADALCDRLIHNSHKIQLRGESLRKTLDSRLHEKPAPLSKD